MALNRGHIPAPFSRTRIDLRPAEARRTWQNARVENLAVGDVVADEGAITLIERLGSMRYIQFLSGDGITRHNDDMLFAFTEDQSG